MAFMLFNSMVPRFAIKSADDAFFSSIVEGQSYLFEFYTLSALPIKIIEELYTGSLPPKSTKKKQPPKAHDTDAASGSLSFVTVGNKTLLAEKGNSGLILTQVSSTAAFSRLYTPSRTGPPGRFSEAAFMLVIIMMFIMLPRRSVNEDAPEKAFLLLRNTGTNSVPVFLFL